MNRRDVVLDAPYLSCVLLVGSVIPINSGTLSAFALRFFSFTLLCTAHTASCLLLSTYVMAFSIPPFLPNLFPLPPLFDDSFFHMRDSVITYILELRCAVDIGRAIIGVT